MQLSSGSRLGHYEIIALLGSGGMGEVYRASDSRLGREVALKILSPEMSSDRIWLQRFQREARSLAALDHPGIVTVFSVEEAEGIHFLTMQLVAGQILGQMIPPSGLPLDRILDIAIPLADALAAAHAKQIVHRDIKPGNIMVSGEMRVKVLDFGLAKLSETGVVSAEDPTRAQGPTQQGVIIGTMPYMSPEQLEGGEIGPASDVFSLGVVLYEMATGRRPFKGDSAPALMSAILKETPEPPSRVRSGFSKELDTLIARCLEKDPAMRPGAEQLRDELSRLRDPQAGARRPPFARAAFLVPLALVLAGALGASWFTVARSNTATFIATSVPEIERLGRETKFAEAFALAREVEERGSSAAISAEVWETISYEIAVESTPPGATVSFRSHGAEQQWTVLGSSPLAAARVPRGPLHWRAELEGHSVAQLLTAYPENGVRFELRRAESPDRDMILIPRGKVDLWSMGAVTPMRGVPLGSFLIDRQEVTNAQFKRFIDEGGYRRPELWKHPFRDGGSAIAFESAMARFIDATGRPGPSTWRLGSFHDGEEDLPVSGVSWYEAAAYAQLAGKELPTLYHWYQADTAGDIQLLPGLILPEANFESAAPQRAGEGSQSAFGANNMAGNVREWSSSTTEDGARMALGGAWNDPSYIYLIPQLLDTFDRSVGNGFRCIRRTEGQPLHADATKPLARKGATDYATQKPASDELYEVFKRFFDRERVPLDARIESTDESSRHWIKQKVSYAAGYGGERMIAWLYLPRSAGPPYQVVIQLAGASTFYRSKSSANESDIFGWSYAEYLIRGGRAVLIPIWKGSYERQDGFHPFQSGADVFREHAISWVTELRQSIDYLESRDDIRPDAIAFQGISFGAIWSPLFLALEPRLKTGILLLGGLPSQQATKDPQPPELQSFNYAPRVKVPVLMMNGRYDPIFPYELSQRPLFETFGTDESQKKHLTFPAGHSAFGWRDQLDREGLEWLDRLFGPVESKN